MDRRLAAMLAIGMTGLVLIVGLVLTPPPPTTGGPVGSAPSLPPAPTPIPPEDALAPLRDAVVVVDGRFDDQPKRTVQGPTRHKNQSKLFFADGTWWGVLQEPASRESRIHRLDWTTQRWHDTGVVVDERSFARADVLYHDDVLYVASAGGSESPAHAVRVSLYDYDPGTRTWTPRPDFPVTISPTGVESSLIDRASDGRLWVSYIEAGQLLVSHSLEDAYHWVAPYRPVVAGTDVATDQVGMVAVEGEVVLLWSNQNDEAIYATSHRDGDPDEVWAPATTVLQGLKLADNHVNIKALPDGRIYAAVKTSLDTVPGRQPGWDQILLLTRQDGRWSSQQVGQIRDKHTRPIVVLDTEHEEALLFATAPASGGAIYMKHAPFEQLRFPTGRGVEALATTPFARINDATSTKQPVDASTGLVILAADDTTGRYVHLAASLGGIAPGVPSNEAPPDGPEPEPAEPSLIVEEYSDVRDVGTPIHPMWEMAPSRADGTVTYVRRSASDIAVRLRTTGAGELRPCRKLPIARSGTVSISMSVRLDRQGPADTILVMPRGDGEELGALRVDDQLRVRVSRKGNRETTDVRLQPGAWYGIRMDLDVAARTYAVRLLDGERVILERTDQPWRADVATRVDGLCVAAGTGAPGVGLSFDDLVITRTP